MFLFFFIMPHTFNYALGFNTLLSLTLGYVFALVVKS